MLVVFDGAAWFVRQVRAIEHRGDTDEKVYYCDEHIGGPYKSLHGAVIELNSWLRSKSL